MLCQRTGALTPAAFVSWSTVLILFDWLVLWFASRFPVSISAYRVAVAKGIASRSAILVLFGRLILRVASWCPKALLRSGQFVFTVHYQPANRIK